MEIIALKAYKNALSLSKHLIYKINIMFDRWRMVESFSSKIELKNLKLLKHQFLSVNSMHQRKD